MAVVINGKERTVSGGLINAEELGCLSERCNKHNGLPLKTCVVFDDGASARRARRLIRQVTEGGGLDMTLLRLDEHLWPPEGNGWALATADTELFVVAMRNEGELPGFAKAWFRLWASLCEGDHDCALVAVVTDGSSPLDPRSPLVMHLESIAIAGGLAFFYGRERDWVHSGAAQDTERNPRHTLTQPSAFDWMSARTSYAVHRWGINE